MRPTALQLFALAILAMQPAGAGAEDRWQEIDRIEGTGAHTLYRRELPDARVAAFRLEGSVEAPIERVVRAQEIPPRAVEGGPRREWVRRDAEVSVIYTYMPLPLLADRDLVLRQEHRHDPATGSHRFVWRTVEDEGPPPVDGVVRIRRSEGMWEFTPQGPASTRLVLESLTDAGGALPAWLTNRFYPDQLRREWNDLIERIAALDPPDR